jgi:hypothetical protein
MLMADNEGIPERTKKNWRRGCETQEANVAAGEARLAFPYRSSRSGWMTLCLCFAHAASVPHFQGWTKPRCTCQSRPAHLRHVFLAYLLLRANPVVSSPKQTTRCRVAGSRSSSSSLGRPWSSPSFLSAPPNISITFVLVVRSFPL